MDIEDLLWNEDVVDKLAVKHGVETWEVEEIFDNGPHVRFRQRGRRAGEDLYAALGQTDAGRYLIVFFIYKPAQAGRPQNQAFIVSARDMADKERKYYERL